MVGTTAASALVPGNRGQEPVLCRPQPTIPGEMAYAADGVAPAASVPPESGAEGAHPEREGCGRTRNRGPRGRTLGVSRASRSASASSAKFRGAVPR